MQSERIRLRTIERIERTITVITLVVAFAFRLLALHRGWDEPETPDTPEDERAGEKPRGKLGEANHEEREYEKSKKAEKN